MAHQPASIDDEIDALVERAISGDEAAWAELDAFYRPRLIGFARSRGVARSDAEDLVQKLMLKARASYDPSRSRFPTYVYLLAHYAVLRFFEAQGRRARSETLRADIEARFGELDVETLVGPDTLADTSPSPERIFEEKAAVASRLGRVLAAAFGGGTLPHQSITFGFVKLLEWRPDEVVTELAPDLLNDLTERLDDDLRRQLRLPDSMVGSSLEPLRNKLKRRVEELITHPKRRTRYETLLARVTGETAYREYFGDAAHVDVVRWWEACLRDTRKTLAEEAA